MSYKVDTSKPVLVTGATGYVAGVLIQQLLQAGVTVHATVRDPSKTERLQYLKDAANGTKGSIKFFQADLVDYGSFAEGMKGCSIVFHTASPFIMSPKDAQTELIEPAVKGVENVLKQANQTPSVKRVVLTSSTVAIFNDASDKYNYPNEVFDEECWNRGASPTYAPYQYSKTLAEQKAWVIAGSQLQWKLVTCNPGFVMGPGLKYHETSESYTFFKSLVDGQMASGCVNFAVPFVDVRDVAEGHIAAAYSDKADGRHALVGHSTTAFAMAQALAKFNPDYPIPTSTVPKMVAWLFGPFLAPVERKWIWRNVNTTIVVDNTKSKQLLGLKYHSMEDTMCDMMELFIQLGIVSPKK